MNQCDLYSEGSIINSRILYAELSSANGEFGPKGHFFNSEIPSLACESLDLSSLPILNEKACRVQRCRVWFPKGHANDLLRLKIEIVADTYDCILFFLKVPHSLSLSLGGRAHAVVMLSGGKINARVSISDGASEGGRGSLLVVGEGCYVGGARMFLCGTDLLIGRDALWSDDILVQGANEHDIVDLRSVSIVTDARNRVVCEPHVWIGRRATLCSGARIGSGSILGTAAVVANHIGEASIAVGNPARAIRRDRSWCRSFGKISTKEKRIFKRLAKHYRTRAVKTMLRRLDWLPIQAICAGMVGAALFGCATKLVALIFAVV